MTADLSHITTTERQEARDLRDAEDRGGWRRIAGDVHEDWPDDTDTEDRDWYADVVRWRFQHDIPEPKDPWPEVPR